MRQSTFHRFPAWLLLALLDCSSGFCLGKRRFLAAQQSHSTLLTHVNNPTRRSSRHPFSGNEMQTSRSNVESISANANRTVRILCLHGKGGSGKKFVNISLEPLRRLIDKRVNSSDAHDRILFQWDEVCAPYKLSTDASNVEKDDDVGFSWWGLPEGMRSFNALEYEGFHESETRVMDALYSSLDGNECKYDIILGHSQGAILLAALLCTNRKLWKDPTSPKGFLLNGVAWPNPFGDDMQTMIERVQHDPSKSSHLPPMLFIMGKADNINPIESAKRVRDTFEHAGFDVTTVEHDGGHSVPYKSDDDSMRALEEVADWIMSILNIQFE